MLCTYLAKISNLKLIGLCLKIQKEKDDRIYFFYTFQNLNSKYYNFRDDFDINEPLLIGNKCFVSQLRYFKIFTVIYLVLW